MKSVSVVIPSLGNVNLLKTINVLNSGTFVPNEIIVCVPDNTILSFNVPSNCEILYCQKRSQVAQRVEGFRKAKYEFILQLDDDTHMDKYCLANLLVVLNKFNFDCAVAPIILDSETKESIYKNESIKSTVTHLKYFIANGLRMYKPGSVTLVGSCFGPSLTIGVNTESEVEWLAGCCILHKRKNIITEDFYPFKGKAYGEDLIASYLYKKKSIRFYISTNALCYTDSCSPLESSFAELLKELRAKYYYITLSDRKLIRFYVYYAFKCLYEISINSPKRILKRFRDSDT